MDIHLMDLRVSVVALHALPVIVDPIPKDIREEFGLLSLHDAYFGIHKPKDISEADLARKRLIFDEFFYLQLGQLFQMLEGLGTQVEKVGLLDKYRRPENNTVQRNGPVSPRRFWSSFPILLLPVNCKLFQKLFGI
ncbi:hypothetical protein MtrunA17_Chr3g0119111 [Medicago truncatula]|uniref:Uncharacterized protein n=1 Tax=Medicago truncatula TaxID=3880 RepID=A0A396ITN1_MEDTR|nr:hypothetical protein MtrunA17_Chr3g0119111 [Medicago truncatula]